MNKINFKSKLQNLKPKVVRGITNTIQGYMFGCMIGVFTNKDQSFKSIHNSGKDIAKVCAVYSITESILETVQKDTRLNSTISGSIAGLVCSKGKLFSNSTLLGTIGLSTYASFGIKDNKK